MDYIVETAEQVWREDNQPSHMDAIIAACKENRFTTLGFLICAHEVGSDPDGDETTYMLATKALELAGHTVEGL